MYGACYGVGAQLFFRGVPRFWELKAPPETDFDKRITANGEKKKHPSHGLGVQRKFHFFAKKVNIGVFPTILS